MTTSSHWLMVAHLIIVRAAEFIDYADRYAFIASLVLFMIFFRKKQRTNAKNGLTKVPDWQDVGVEKST